MPRALLIHSNQHQPWHNLALEAFLFEQVEQQTYQAVLYLWQNDHTVVIGRNQNAWAECDTGQLEADGGWLARRSTGGGAVYHDLGNLNFSILLPRSRFSIDDQFEVVLKAIRQHDIPAERSGRNDLLVNGMKFSGNAFSLKKKAGLHHGTLLVHSDYARLSRYLTVSAKKLQAKGVSSVRARVTNLQDINPSLTVTHLNQSLEEAFCQTFCDTADWQLERATSECFEQEKRLQELQAHFSSWSWRYGRSLPVDASVDERFDWGSIQLGFQVQKGRVDQVRVFSDALDSDYMDLLPQSWVGCRFHSAELIQALQRPELLEGGLLTPRRQLTADISRLIQAQNW